VQVVFNFRNVVAGGALFVAAWYGYDTLFGDIGTRDVGKLMRAHRDAQGARQLIIKQRILAVYSSARDYPTVLRALDSASPVTQALAVEILAAERERRAVPTLLEALENPERPDIVKEQLAHAFASLLVTEAIPRLIELTDIREAREVRAAAHSALRALTGVGGEIGLGDGTREMWSLWWRSHRDSVNR